jgi:hypothetical protein
MGEQGRFGSFLLEKIEKKSLVIGTTAPTVSLNPPLTFSPKDEDTLVNNKSTR